MACTVSDFRNRFEEFSDEVAYPDSRIELFLQDAIDFYMGTDEKRWCKKYNYAHCYLTAHLLVSATLSELGDTSASVGPIVSKSAAYLSITKGVKSKDRSDSDEFLMSTGYGQRFLITRDGCFPPAMVTGTL